MTAKSILLTQIESSIDDISRALGTLESSNLDTRLLQRVQARFRIDLIENQKRTASLRDSVRKIPDDAPLDTAWSAYASLKCKGAAVLSECLAFIEGALARTNGIDAGICRVADAMLYDLSTLADVQWPRFTILADGEFFAGLSGMIRIRFSDTSVWSLPVSAHELGHYVATAWNDSTLADLITRAKRKDTRFEAYLNEHFADLFATYATGPAFAMTCALSRFSPASALESGKKHPAAAHRMWWILETLRSIDRSTGRARQYGDIAGEIERLWTASLEAAAVSAEIDSADRARLNEWLAELFDVLDTKLSNVRYRGWARAQEMAESFRNKQRPVLGPNDRIPDVLNAAWLCRSEAESGDGYLVQWLGDNAFDLCATLAKAAD